MVFILQYTKRSVGCSLCYRQNLNYEAFQVQSLHLQVPILGSSSQILQKWGVVINHWNPKRSKSQNRGGGGQIPEWVPKPKESPPPPPPPTTTTTSTTLPPPPPPPRRLLGSRFRCPQTLIFLVSLSSFSLTFSSREYLLFGPVRGSSFILWVGGSKWIHPSGSEEKDKKCKQM